MYYCFFFFCFTDKSIDSWLFISSPWPLFVILTVYTTFVLKLGPKFMKHREPINIKYLVLFYNLMQAAFNSYILVYVSEQSFPKQQYYRRFLNNCT